MDVVRIPHSSRQTIIVLSKLCITLILCAVLIFNIHKVWETGYFRYKIRQLNRIMPYSFGYLIKVEKTNLVDTQSLVAYKYFYQQIIKYFPDQADAFGMLGYCQFYAGNLKSARESFQKAIELNKDFFWFHYNLAVVDYKAEHLEEALASIKKALSCDSQKSLYFIQSSNVVYRSIMNDGKITIEDIRRRLIVGYKNAGLIANAIEDQLKQNNQNVLNLGARIF